MFQVRKLNQGVSSLGIIYKALVRSEISLLMCIVPKYLKKQLEKGKIWVGSGSILVNLRTKICVQYITYVSHVH